MAGKKQVKQQFRKPRAYPLPENAERELARVQYPTKRPNFHAVLFRLPVPLLAITSLTPQSCHTNPTYVHVLTHGLDRTKTVM